MTEPVTNPGKTCVIRIAAKAGRRPMSRGGVFALARGLPPRRTRKIAGTQAVHEIRKVHDTGTVSLP